MRGEIFQWNFIVNFKHLDELAIIRRLFGARDRGRDGSQSDARFSSREPAERSRSRGENFGMRRHALAGQDVERRQDQRSAARASQLGKGTKQRKERFSLFIAVNDDELRTP